MAEPSWEPGAWRGLNPGLRLDKNGHPYIIGQAPCCPAEVACPYCRKDPGGWCPDHRPNVEVANKRGALAGVMLGDGA